MQQTARPKNLNSDSGFTMVELLVVVSLLSIVFASAVPYMREMIASFSRHEARQALDFDLRYARTRAVREGTRSIVTVSGNSYTVGIDNLPYSDPAVADTVVLTRNLPSDIALTISDTIIFDSRGNSIDAAGNLSTAGMTLAYESSTFATGTVYASGLFNLTCS